jgi:hypothetical protein
VQHALTKEAVGAKSQQYNCSIIRRENIITTTTTTTTIIIIIITTTTTHTHTHTPGIATYQETMKFGNYRKQPYWALHTYFRKC